MICLAILAVTASSIYDGDTARLPGNNARLTRFEDAPYDTPEIGGQAECPEERALGLLARDRLREMMPGAVCIIGRGNGGYGRDLAVMVGSDGRDVGAALIEEGLAVPSKTFDWCTVLR